jgi:hypothetical protein
LFLKRAPSFSDALRLEPNSPEVLALRGLVLFLSAKLPQAAQHAASALRLDPGHKAAMQLRKRVKDVERLKEEGNVAFKMSRLQEAVDKYGEALDVSMPFLVLARTHMRHACISGSENRWKRARAARSARRCCLIVQRHS